jgi:hypothetical protein
MAVKIDQAVELIIGLILIVFLLTQGLAPALLGENFSLIIGDTDYTWALGLMVLVTIFGLVFILFKSAMHGGKK